MSTASAARREIPEATVARLPVYLRALRALSARGVDVVSSEELAEAAGVRSAGLRKDLSHLGSYGVRGVGYDVARLSDEISRELGLHHDWSVAIIGMGNLGHALAAYSGFATRGFQVRWLIDEDPAIVGTEIAGLKVITFADLEKHEPDSIIAVIATPPEAAQTAADQAIALGVRSILNFAPGVLAVPPGVEVRKVDLATELQILAFHEQRGKYEQRGELEPGGKYEQEVVR
ncbi:redox-sensing transcriptional repressor Rex [Flexivirga sp. ID2601S]|uniref:Redox-sensing transcriptional repressor Rex n=1 Tax=Flexivirga aerilata TaxID=1656889 RepID=A0A849AM85_9MICO|nr:redox-sensing transcriptional repressor Rex [Flexivirga aerilata]